MKYLIPVILLGLSWVAVLLGGWWTTLIPAITFGLVPLLELVLPTPATPDQSPRRYHDILLLMASLGQVGLTILLMAQVSSGALSGLSLFGAVATVGIAAGAFGINIAHELGHRRTRLAQDGAKMLLLTTLYMHFFIEHNRGHHANVATPNDPASAPRGMGLYRFWWRSLTGSYRSAWAIESRRLARKDQPWLTWDNEMVRFTVIQLVAVMAAGAVFGPLALMCWLVSALIGVLLLETVNYIEHYGLERTQDERGRYERVQPLHSWNAEHPLGRALLFELTRHADHHAYPGRSYPALRHQPDSPQLPTGYPGMILVSLVPPLWFRVMDPHVDAEHSRLSRAHAEGR
ncbi:MAG: alkane 1-monooxygenase [Myxococcota bacterium]